eukprot:TRINITY_DN11823_c0_g1_i1.p1 TRINITY_DN11823_c0_g1~~TRINITY_DN11823_c0_g1_i1.p1  ORF type:complete len:154 (-),score=24.96 TRINITY_DN11823_c0_g1_i1:46-507(-)
MDDKEEIRNILQTILSTPSDLLCIFDICPNVVVSLEVMRVWLGTNNLWLDFSNWSSMGKKGIYVVGTYKTTGNASSVDMSWGDILAVFDDNPVFKVPSKYFACMHDVANKAMDVVFNEKDKEEGGYGLAVYPIMRQSPNIYKVFNEVESDWEL